MTKLEHSVLSELVEKSRINLTRGSSKSWRERLEQRSKDYETLVDRLDIFCKNSVLVSAIEGQSTDSETQSYAELGRKVCDLVTGRR
jgi:hypothetical protein